MDSGPQAVDRNLHQSSGQRIAVDGPLQFLIFPPIPPLLGKEDITRALTDSENGIALYHFKNVKLVSGF